MNSVGLGMVAVTEVGDQHLLTSHVLMFQHNSPHRDMAFGKDLVRVTNKAIVSHTY